MFFGVHPWEVWLMTFKLRDLSVKLAGTEGGGHGGCHSPSGCGTTDLDPCGACNTTHQDDNCPPTTHKDDDGCPPTTHKPPPCPPTTHKPGHDKPGAQFVGLERLRAQLRESLAAR